MESIYSALLLHKAEKSITEDNIKKVLKAAGIDGDEEQIAKLVAGLKQTDIEEIIKNAAAGPVTAAAAPVGGAAPEEGEEEEAEEDEEEEEEEEDEEVAGIGSLF
ncbi:MAG: 50S ribosomal protein P1 [Promethearchaeia archaeon]